MGFFDELNARRAEAVGMQSVVLAVCSFFVIMGIVLLAHDRHLAIVSLPCILFFGAGAAVCAWMTGKSRKRA